MNFADDHYYLDYIGDMFYAKVKHRKFITKEVRCFRLNARCPITGKKQFLRKCVMVRFNEADSKRCHAIFYCELHEFEKYMFMNDFSSNGIIPSFRRKDWY